MIFACNKSYTKCTSVCVLVVSPKISFTIAVVLNTSLTDAEMMQILSDVLHNECEGGKV
jgi:hypothetical protein